MQSGRATHLHLGVPVLAPGIPAHVQLGHPPRPAALPAELQLRAHRAPFWVAREDDEREQHRAVDREHARARAGNLHRVAHVRDVHERLERERRRAVLGERELEPQAGARAVDRARGAARTPLARPERCVCPQELGRLHVELVGLRVRVDSVPPASGCG